MWAHLDGAIDSGDIGMCVFCLTLLLASPVLLPLLPPLFPHLIIKYCSFRHLSVNGHIIFGKELVNNSHLPRMMAEYGFVRAFWKSELYPEYFIHKAALIIFFSLVGY